MAQESRKRTSGALSALIILFVASPEWIVGPTARLLKVAGILTLPDNAATLMGWMGSHELLIKVPACAAAALGLSYAFLGPWWRRFASYNAARSARRCLEPIHIIALGLVIAVGGVAWQTFWPRATRAIAAVETTGGYTPALPRFPTQFDKEKFRGALDDMSDIALNMRKLFELASPLAGSRPVVQEDRSAVEPLDRMKQIRALYDSVDARLFATGHGPFFDQYPLHKDTLLKLMPNDSQRIWHEFLASLHAFQQAVELIGAAERHASDSELRRFASSNAYGIQDRFQNAVSGLNDLSLEITKRIRQTIEAIP